MVLVKILLNVLKLLVRLQAFDGTTLRLTKMNLENVGGTAFFHLQGTHTVNLLWMELLKVDNEGKDYLAFRAECRITP